MWTHNNSSAGKSETIDLTDSPPKNDKKRRRQNSEIQSVSSKVSNMFNENVFLWIYLCYFFLNHSLMTILN